MPTHFNLLGNDASFLPQRSSLLDSYRSNLMERRKDAPDTLDLLKNTGQWMKENPLDALAIGTAPIPVAGDVIGVANASIAKINGVAMAAIGKVNGVA